LDKKSIWTLSIGVAVLLFVLTLGFVFRDKQPADYTHLPSTDWFLAIPFLLLMFCLVPMGYFIDRRINNGKIQ